MSYLKLLFAMLAVIQLQASEPLTPVTLQLQWKHQFQFAGYYMAKEKGFYKDAGIDVAIKEYAHGIDTINDIHTIKTEFATGRSSLILHKEKDILLLSAIFQSSPFILHAKKRPDIQTLHDIQNKTVMISNAIEDMAAINAMLKAEGITTHDFIIKETSFNPDDLINNKVDFMTSYISNEPFILQQKGIESIIFDPKDYGFDFYGDMLFTSSKLAKSNPQLVDKFRKASLKGWEYAFSHIKESINLILEKYNTQNKSIEALFYEAYTLKKLALIPDIKLGTIELPRLREIANTYKLLGLEANSKRDLSSMIYKPLKAEKNALTKEEQTYLLNRESIKMCIDPNWMPYEKLEHGKHVGMSSDYFKYIQKFIKKPIEVVPTKRWQESLELGQKRECDIFSLIMKTPQRETFLNFTDSYFSFPLVIATTMEKSYINNIKSILDKKIAMVKGYAFIELLKTKYPNINIIEVDNIANGLKLVKEQKVYGYIDALPTLNYEIQRNHINSLKIDGQFDERWELGIGIRNDDPILYSIFEKAVKNIDAKNVQNIYDSWLQVSYAQKFDIKTLLQWFGLIASILLLVLYKYLISIRHNKQLKESLESFEMLMESTLEGIFVFDKNGICIHANKVISKLYGYTKKELIGKHAIEFIAPLSQELIKMKMKNPNQSPYEAQMIRKNGSLFFALVRGHDIVWNDKNVRISSVIDISKLKQLQLDVEALNINLEQKVASQVEDIRQKDQMLMQQSKLAAMGEMIGAIAHQWRQPLNALNINIQNLDDDFEEGLVDKEFIDELIKKNSQTIQFMSKTIDDFKNFYQVDKVKEPFFILKKIQTVIEIQIAQLNHYNIIITISGDDFEIDSYASEFQQVILNLINNAKDAIIENHVEYGKIEISIKDHSIIFKDNGGGIKEKTIERIFEPYFTTKEQGQGTGIGLYMSKLIIEENMGGKISVKNSDNGAEFRIDFLNGAADETPTQLKTLP